MGINLFGEVIMSSITEQKIIDQIQQLITENSDLKSRVVPADIGADTEWSRDMGFDSLAMLSLVYELQDLYPDLEETLLSTWTTVADAVKDIIDAAE